MPLVFILTVKKMGDSRGGGVQSRAPTFKMGTELPAFKNRPNMVLHHCYASVNVLVILDSSYKIKMIFFLKLSIGFLVMETTTFGERNLDIL